MAEKQVDPSSSGEEVKSKPVPPQQPQNEPPPFPGSAVDSGHHDILVLGRTGTGKSSTVDKLLVPDTQDYRIISKDPVDFNTYRPHTYKPEKDNEHRSKVQNENLSAWVLSDDPDEQANTEVRLKNVVFSRQIEGSHRQIDQNREDKCYEKVYESSKTCQLLVNDDSNVCVLDTPGFFSPDLIGGAKTAEASNLAIIRQIVYTQLAAGLRFCRVLYFLPTGMLKRSDRTLQQEVRCIAKFFEKSIFTCMVLVGTIDDLSSQDTSRTNEQKFPPSRIEASRKLFHEAVKREYKEQKEDGSNIPVPPMIFISMTDTCEEILQKVMSAPVENDQGLQVKFSNKICTRCCAEIRHVENESFVCTYRDDTDKLNTVPYNESRCHPKLLPKVTAKTFFRGLAELFLLKWHFSEEQCINPDCKQGPGSPGCRRVLTEYVGDGQADSITVKHTDLLDCKIATLATAGGNTK